MTQPTIKGYKVFLSNFTSKEGGMLFKENETFEVKLPIQICRWGLHFCVKASHCFSYYSFDPANIVCEVEALGETQTHEEDSKVCTNILRVGRRLTWDEVLQVANEGKNNTGHSNTGNSNTGNWNTGNRNTGDNNTGDRNTGNRNTGDNNTGDRNTGNRNTGYNNTGNWNTGDRNTGDLNTGYNNTGNWNTGDRNTGDLNTGNNNTGDWNTGDRNTGDRNTGNWNTGDRNTGYFNTGDWNTGVFCTGAKYMDFFNKPSTWTEQDFLNSKAYNLLCNVDIKMWIYPGDMTEEEKEKHPSYKTCDGYLKDIPFKEAFQNKWHNWSSANQNEFKKLPNFDTAIFEEITGIKL